MSPWRKLPACGRKRHRKLEAYATCFSNGAKPLDLQSHARRNHPVRQGPELYELAAPRRRRIVGAVRRFIAVFELPKEFPLLRSSR